MSKKKKLTLTKAEWNIYIRIQKVKEKERKEKQRIKKENRKNKKQRS